MNLSHHERFDIIRTTWAVYAPFSLGCPSMTTATDYPSFKKTKEEKAKVKEFKANLPKSRGFKFKTIFHGSF